MKIAERELSVTISGTRHAVMVCVFAPVPSQSDFACTYEINWPDGVEHRESHGIDSMQALQLTLQQIGVSLYSSDYHERRQLVWEQPGQGYGFPLPSNARDLLVGQDARFF
jgi:hypothetical protein